MEFRNALRARLQHLSVAALCTLCLAIGFAAGSIHQVTAAQSMTEPPPEAQEAFSAFWQAYNLIQSEYIEVPPIETLVDGATKGLFDALNDQFSGYMPPDVFDMMNADLEGEIEGIGVVIRETEDRSAIEVVGLINGAPAQAAGILPGDIFVEVDGQSVLGMTQLELAIRVRGPAGTPVRIVMQRGEDRLEFTINRERIIIPNVETDILDGNIAYIRLNQFSATARTDLNNALAALDVNSRTGLIFDVRDNPGGLLSSAVEIASAFVREGTIIREIFGDGREQIYSANGSYANIEVPIVLLINEGSASASEILAGALQDGALATLIGETTFGKGTVQSWHDLVNGGGARITIARWITPSGRSIHENGVSPDIEVDWTPTSYDSPEDPQLDAAVAFLLNDPAGVIAAQQAAGMVAQ